MKFKVKYEDRFAIIATLIISVITLSFGTRESPFDYTLSMIGNRFDARLEFIVWGIITASFFNFICAASFQIRCLSKQKSKTASD